MVSDSFGECLNRALQTDVQSNWALHTIDYPTFKSRLKFFARRRSRLRTMMKESPDGRIHEQVLQTMLAIAPNPTKEKAFSQASSLNESDGYVPYVDVDFAASSDVSSVASHGKRKKKLSVLRRVGNVERQEIANFLRNETDKAHMYYMACWHRICVQLEDSPQESLAPEILDLLAFSVCNVVTIRQVLIRYDAYARTFEGNVMRDYYLKQVGEKHTPYRNLARGKEVWTLAETYFEHDDEFRRQCEMLRGILKATDSTSVPLSRALKDNFFSKLWTWFLMGGLLEDRLGLEPAYLMLRGQNLATEMKQLADWREDRRESCGETCRPKKLSGMQIYHLTLNLLSAFLYCMNYYIVEPSSTMYVNRLGAPDATQGILMGMTPLGAFLSSLPFSMWTNRSFRHPFIASGILLITGNLMYGWADRSRNVSVAMLGRLITGMGAPKCIIRRYMADTTPVSLRTSVNAGFGMVVAAGSALGPAMAILLDRAEYMVAFPGLGVFALNGLTLPGYFMACLWMVFTFIVVMTFDEPDRAGLEEQILLESQGQIPGSPTMSVMNDGDTIESRSFDKLSQSDTKSFDVKSLASMDYSSPVEKLPRHATLLQKIRHFLGLITLPVRLCLGLLFAKVFTIESLVSATSIVSRNRYQWKISNVGLLGFSNGILVIPFSIVVGRLSMSYQDHVLMLWLLGVGCFGMFLLIDMSDMMETSTPYYNEGHPLAVGPQRYIAGYFISYLSIQTFEGVIGSTLSKVIPTALASGTVNSGLLATMVDTLGRATGDMFISAMAFSDLRQLMNLLFIPGFCIILTCFIVIERYRDLLSV